MRGIEACASKRVYQTPGEAASVVRGRQRSLGKDAYLRIYQCAICGGFHLTSRKEPIAAIPNPIPDSAPIVAQAEIPDPPEEEKIRIVENKVVGANIKTVKRLIKQWWSIGKGTEEIWAEVKRCKYTDCRAAFDRLAERVARCSPWRAGPPDEVDRFLKSLGDEQ